MTPDVPRISPFLKPVMVASNVGLASPYARVLLLAVTVRLALLIVKTSLSVRIVLEPPSPNTLTVSVGVPAGLDPAVVTVSVKLQPVPPPELALQDFEAGLNVAPAGRPDTAIVIVPFPLPATATANVAAALVPYVREPTWGLTEIDVTDVAAATYGPTMGPPKPNGVAPAGCTESVDVELSARARLIRPFPVWATVPAASADVASRFTMTPFERLGSWARSSAAAAATIADEADVPVMVEYPPPAFVTEMFVPGAARKTSVP